MDLLAIDHPGIGFLSAMFLNRWLTKAEWYNHNLGFCFPPRDLCSRVVRKHRSAAPPENRRSALSCEGQVGEEAEPTSSRSYYSTHQNAN